MVSPMLIPNKSKWFWNLSLCALNLAECHENTSLCSHTSSFLIVAPTQIFLTWWTEFHTFRRVELACSPGWFTELARSSFDMHKNSTPLHFEDQATLFEIMYFFFLKTSFWLSWQLMYYMVSVDLFVTEKDC